AMELGQLADDRQADSGPLDRGLTVLLQAVVALEDARRLARRDAGPFVLDRDPDLSVARLDRDPHRLPGLAVPDGVIQQVEEDLPEGITVHRGHGALGQLEGELGSPALGERLELVHQLANERHEVAALRRQPRFAALGTREPEDVLDEMSETARLPVDD